MRYNDQWVKDYLAAMRADKRQALEGVEFETPDNGPESKLQKACETLLNGLGWPFLSLRRGRYAKRFLIAGWPDLTIAGPNGKTVFIELKAKGGRRSKEQIQTHLELMALGHEIYTVKSFKRFKEIIEGMKGGDKCKSEM